DKAFLPFENSTAGFIAENFRLLDSSSAFVTHEFIHRVEHCLLGPKGTRIEDVESVLSHPQALAQCARFLHGRHLKTEPWFDTAGAARDVSRMKNKAAIASEEAARVYGLEVLKKGINDQPENFTRFLAIGRERVWGKRLLVSCGIGELRSILRRDVKLVTMLTHADDGVLWGHKVYLELESTQDVPWSEWLKNFAQLKVLGSFDGNR
ncbi:MAG: bifunctional chorismate mutase/prephenate dehydratase, partial [Proteobacteria bacterium]